MALIHNFVYLSGLGALGFIGSAALTTIALTAPALIGIFLGSSMFGAGLYGYANQER